MAINIGYTLGDIFGNVLKGAMKTLEGIYDFGVGTVGTVGGLFSSNFSRETEAIIRQDWTKNNTRWLDEAQRYSHVNDWKYGENVRNIAGGVGGMLPSVVVSFIPGAGPALSMGTTMTGAAGSSTEEALNSGARLENAFAYGVGSGLIEGATEKIGGFAFGKTSKLGKSLVGTRAGGAISKGIGKFAFDAVSEGAEEVLSDVANPALKYLTGVDRNIGQNYKDTLRGLPQTFVEGALVGSVMQGGYTAGTNIKNTVQGRGGAKATRADAAIENISEISKLYGKDRDKNFRYDTAIKRNLTDVSAELVKMKPEQRKSFLERAGTFKSAFDEGTGKLKENLVADVNQRAISSKLRTISGTLTHKPLKSNEGITKEAESIKETVERVLGKSATVAVTNELDIKDKALFSPRDGVIYISNKAKFTGEDKAKIVALHEIAHTTEGTRAYTSFIKTLEKVMEDKSAPKSIKDIIGDVSARTDKIKSDYKEQIEGLGDKYSQGYLVQSELHADVAAELLGNDYFVDKLAQRDESLFKKIFDSLKSRANAKKSELGPDGVKYLNKLSSKFATAIDKRAGGVMLSSLGEEEEKGKEEKINADSQKFDVRFSKQQIPGTNEYFVVTEQDSIDKLNKYPGNSLAAKVRNYLKQFRGTVLPLGNAKKAYMRREAEGEYTNPAKNISPDNYNGKLNVSSEIVNLLSSAEFLGHEDDNGRHPDAVRGWDYYSVKYVVPDEEGNLHAYKGEMQIKLIERGDCFYDITKIEDITSGTAGQALIKAAGSAQISSTNSVPQNSENVNSSDERKYKSSENEPEFVEADGGVKVNFNDFDTYKSNDNSNDNGDVLEVAERARQESLDSLVSSEAPKKLSYVSQSEDSKLLSRVVNNTKAKKFTKKDVKSAIDELLSKEGYYGDNVVALKGKNRSEAEQMLWKELNTKGEGELGGAALEIADYIIRNTIAKEYSDVTEDVQSAAQFLDALKPYLHNMNLDFIKGDIKAKFDKDNTPYLMWGVKKGSPFRGYTADEVAQELSALGFNIDKTSEADIFLEIDKLYRLAKQAIIDATPSKENLVSALGSKKAQKLKQKLAKDIIEVQHTKGTETSFFKLQQKYIKQIAELGEKVKTVQKRNTIENRILKEAKKIVDSNKHTFANATEIQTDALKNIKKLLSRVNSREQVNRSSLRAIMKELSIWYSKENPVLGFTDEQRPGFYSSQIAEELSYFAEAGIEDAGEVEGGQSRAPVPTIEISPDSELVERIKNSGKSKYDVIEEYLVEKFYGQEFILSDGKKAIMDKRDANKLSAKANEARTTQLGNLKEIVEKAEYSHSANDVEHNKFSSFDYYSVSIKIGKETFDLWLNVGVAKNDGKHHIYALTNKKEEAPTKNGVSRPVGNAIQNASSINSIAENSQNVKREKALSISELEAVHTILHHMNHIFENYGKMWRGGQYVEVADVASAQYKVLEDAENSASGFERAVLQNKFDRFFLDPMSVLSAWDGHDPNGYFTTTYREFAEGLIGQRYDEMHALEEFDKFRNDKKNKAYMKNLVNGKDVIKIGGKIDPRKGTVDTIEIPKNVAMDLYMVSKTGRAIETLEEVGYKVRVDGKHEQETMSTVTRGQIEEMYNKFSEQDKKLISIMERAYNGICRDLKYETDMKRLGFSNVFEGYYYPITRISDTDFDTDNFFAMMERVSNISANKSRVKGAKNAISVGNALSKFMRHVNAVARYANLAIPVENMNRVFNIDIAGNKHMPTSIKMKLSENDLWKDAEQYMKKLADDVQQIGVMKDGGEKAIAWLRGNYAKFQLGANPKVWFTQLSSYIAAYGELSFSSLAHAPAIKGSIKDSEVDKYCHLAAVRHYDKASTKAQAVTDKAGNALTAPIEAVDRGVIKMLYAACQAEAKSRYKLEIGTEENKIKAGEMLTEVILRSQQNQLITEQSAAMRHKSDLIKSFTMFNADSMKLLSRFIQSMGEIATLNNKIKAAEKKGDKALVETLTAQKKRASKALRKYSAAIIAVAVYMAALAKLFKLAYNKDDEEETVLEWLGEGTVDNIIGMVPLVRDAYSFLNDGYDVNIFVVDMANDVLNSFKKTRDIFVSWVEGKEVTGEQFNSNIKNLVFSVGQVFGFPTRNIYNFATGVIRRIDEGTGKTIDGLFKAPTESGAKESLLEGIEKKDESLINYSLDALYSKYDLEITDKVLKGEMDRLIKLDASKDSEDESNYNPLGFKIPEKLEIDGEDVELSAEDRKVFKNVLESAEKASAQLVRTLMYKRMSDDSKAYAIRKVYEYYTECARETVSGSAERKRIVYFGNEVPIDILANVMAYKRELNAASEESKAKRLKSTKQLVTEYLRQFNLSRIQKSLVLRALGYGDKENDAQVKAYINRKYDLTKEQKAEFLEYAKVG